MDGALRFTQVSKSFGTARRKVTALAEVSFTISTGRITGLIGPDGAGKTTLMRLAACLLMPDAGTITVLGLDGKSQAQAIQSQIGYMPQRFGLYEDLTVRENLNLYADLQGLAHTERKERYDALLALTALGPFGDRRAGQLSGGMKQKLGLACALLRVPRLLLLDEPTVGVDPISRRELWAIIQGLREQGVSVLISTSYMDEAERCDDIILLHEGKVLAQGPPSAFTTPLEGRCFFVQSAELSRRLLQQRLQAEPAVLDARLETSGVRVLLAEGAAPPSVAGAEWHRVPPHFADAFFDRLHAERASPDPVVTPTIRVSPQEISKPETVLSVANLNRFFGSFHAVKDVSFTVHRGEVFGLLGANGAGKSTTFRMLCGLLPASSGVLNVAGQDLRTAPAEARRQIGYVAQKFSLYANLSVAQNLSFFASAYGLGGARRRERLAWAAEEFALAPYLAQNAGDLPLGFKQRLALAAALLHEPPILFLDEPTSGVDPLARTEFWRRINAYSAAGTTVLVTTHFMEEAEYCDHLVLMSLGEVLASGTPAEIRARAATPERPNPTMEEAFIALIEAHEATLRRSR
ncbi:MAG: ATP-binding cassette domain-containing protein [Acidobacteriia bacterium]|nr:ABC transporter ATP-binding protein [Methyloceanibacter sp.]MBX5472428.1 ABC transporter ATP-binding protein [Acetobacteraceae bacterium]MCL6490352.1 ATP-binding cassette domain-containing protein [Terriglobia bacterium]